MVLHSISVNENIESSVFKELDFEVNLNKKLLGSVIKFSINFSILARSHLSTRYLGRLTLCLLFGQSDKVLDIFDTIIFDTEIYTGKLF